MATPDETTIRLRGTAEMTTAPLDMVRTATNLLATETETETGPATVETVTETETMVRNDIERTTRPHIIEAPSIGTAAAEIIPPLLAEAIPRVEQTTNLWDDRTTVVAEVTEMVELGMETDILAQGIESLGTTAEGEGRVDLTGREEVEVMEAGIEREVLLPNDPLDLRRISPTWFRLMCENDD